MKYFYIIIGLVCFSIFYASCIDDKGNYNYESRTGLEGVEISGFNDTIAFRHKILELKPQVKNLEDESRYSYFWYAYREPIGGGIIPQRDTIGTTKILSTEIKLAGGAYYLYFQIKDMERGVYVYKKIKFTVLETPIENGWYVLKDIDNETDFDYVSLNGEEYRDVLRNISGPNGNNQLAGKGVKIHYQPQSYYHQIIRDDGTAELMGNQMALHILSTEDMKTFNAKNLNLFKNYEDEFYGLPEKRSPQALVGASYSGDLYLINGGKLYSIYGMSQNFGKFSGAKVATTSQYDLFPSVLGGWGDCWVFDNLSHSFWRCASSAVNFTYLPAEEEKVSPINMNARMLNLMQLQDLMFTPEGYAVMQSQTDDEEYYLALCTPGNPYIFSSFDTIPAGARMPKAEVKAAPNTGTYIYYAYDNKLYAYKNLKGLDLGQKEVLVKELPAEEKISFIKSVDNPDSGKASVAILTNRATGWKMYLFELVGTGNPEIKPDPVKEFEGIGNARYLMLRK